MPDSDFPAPSEGIVVTHFLVTEDLAASREFYERTNQTSFSTCRATQTWSALS